MAGALIAVLPESEQAFWALAFYAGVRRGELRASRVDDVDFDAGLVSVRRGWDDVEGEIPPKTFAGTRDVPMMGELRRICPRAQAADRPTWSAAVPRSYAD